MASFTETIAANNQAPTEGVDIAGNLQKGLQTGMQLATMKDQLESQKMKMEEDRLKMDQMKFSAFDSMMKNLNRMNPVVAKKMSNNFKNKFQQYGFDPAIVDVTLADPNFGRAYQNLSSLYSGKILSDKEALAQAVQSFNDAGMFAEGLQAMKDAADNQRADKQLDQQNSQFYARLNAEKEIAQMGIKKTEATANKEVAKENRKNLKELDADLKKTEELLVTLNDAKTLFDEYSSKSKTGGTGPVATVGGLTKFANQKTEDLDSAFRTVSLDALVEKFAGMSKAVDTNAERAAFQATQPSITLDDETNKRLLEKRIAAATRMIEKIKAAKSNLGAEVSAEPTPGAGLSPAMQQVVDRALKINPNADIQRVIETAQKQGIK